MRWLSDLDEVDESSLDLADIESYLDLARKNDVPADHPFLKVLEERREQGIAWKASATALLASVRPSPALSGPCSRLTSYLYLWSARCNP